MNMLFKIISFSANENDTLVAVIVLISVYCDTATAVLYKPKPLPMLLRSVRLFIILNISMLIGIKAFSQMRLIYLDDIHPDNYLVKMSFYSASEGFVAFKDWVGYTSDSGNSFIQKGIYSFNTNYNGYNISVGATLKINGVKAFNANKVLVYGNYSLNPAILYSNDGGDNFTVVYYSSYLQLNNGIADMIFPQNSNNGYAIEPDQVLKTTNQGLTWSVIKTTPNSFFAKLEGFDDNNIYTIAEENFFNKIVKTNDGGTNWQTMTLPLAGTGTLLHGFFLNANTGWVSMRDGNSNGVIFKTTNGGSSWVLQNNPIATPFITNNLRFTDANTGYALSTQNAVYKTFNSGINWEPLFRDYSFLYPDIAYNDIQLFSSTQLWAGGTNGMLEISTNGGGAPLPLACYLVDTTGLISSSGNVNMINYSRTGYQYKWYVNNILVSTNYNGSYQHNFLKSVDTIKLVVTSAGHSDSLKKYQYFTVVNMPVISGFSPATGSTGTLVKIRGTSLATTKTVKFGNVSAFSFSISGDTLVNAIVANGATGSIAITNLSGTAFSTGFTYYAPPAAAPPLVSSVTPLSAIAGTTITINGSNLGNSVSENLVSFGATSSQLISANATQIICKVPLGASFEPISILNKQTGLWGASEKPFNVLFADSSSFTGNSFKNLYTMALGGGTPHDISCKDMDNDGKPDLLAIVYNNAGRDSLSIFRNTTSVNNFSFAPAVTYYCSTLQYQVGFLGIGDLDGDGRPDIAYPINTRLIKVMRNTSSPGSLSFENPILLSTPDGTHETLITDIDHDGKNDIAVTSFGDHNVALIRNTSVPGFLSFADTVNLFTVNSPYRIIAADIDGDGKNDLVSYNHKSSSESEFSCFRNIGSTGIFAFSPEVSYTVPGYIGFCHISLSDYDGDSKPDIVIGNSYSLSISRNISTAGNIAFSPPIILGTFQNGFLFNGSGDTKPDIVTGLGNAISLFRNISTAGTVSAESPVTLLNPGHSDCISAADFNMDGKIDIVSSFNDIPGNITIFANNLGNTTSLNYCGGSNAVLNTDITGNNYQWQVDAGTGFTNLANGINYSGVTTSQLSISNISTTWQGYKYRCIVDGNFSQSWLLNIINTWTGAVNNSWENPNNWSCHTVPDAYTIVVVNLGNIIVNSNVTIWSLQLDLPGSIHVNAGFNMTILH